MAERTASAVTNQLAYLVDMTKAEDLYLMRENKKSLEFVERHL